MRPQRSPNIASRELPDGELMLLAADGTEAMVLNPVAAAVWHLIDGQRTVAQIATFITERFPEEAPAKVQAEVSALLEQLLERGMLTSP